MNKKIDDIFKEKFSNFEAKPEDDLWSKIQHDQRWTEHQHRQSVKNLIIYAAIGVVAIVSSIILINSRIKSDVKVKDEVVKEINEMPRAEVTSVSAPPTLSDAEEPALEESLTEALIEPNAPDKPLTSIADEEVQNLEAVTTIAEPAKENPSLPVQTETSSKPTNKQVKENPTHTPVEKAGNLQNAGTAANPSTSSPKPTSSPFSIPNAFTPNGDGLNDVFAPVTNSEIQSYQLDIYSRSGQKLFTSRNLQYGWNGEYQGGMMEGGSYIYFIRYKDADGQEHIDKGQLLLIR